MMDAVEAIIDFGDEWKIILFKGGPPYWYSIGFYGGSKQHCIKDIEDFRRDNKISTALLRYLDELNDKNPR